MPCIQLIYLNFVVPNVKDGLGHVLPWRMATGSRGNRHVDGLRQRLAMLEAVRDDPQRENLRSRHGFVAICTVGQDPRQLRDFSHPTPISLNF